MYVQCRTTIVIISKSPQNFQTSSNPLENPSISSHLPSLIPFHYPPKTQNQLLFKRFPFSQLSSRTLGAVQSISAASLAAYIFASSASVSNGQPVGNKMRFGSQKTRVFHFEKKRERERFLTNGFLGLIGLSEVCFVYSCVSASLYMFGGISYEFLHQFCFCMVCYARVVIFPTSVLLL